MILNCDLLKPTCNDKVPRALKFTCILCLHEFLGFIFKSYEL